MEGRRHIQLDLLGRFQLTIDESEVRLPTGKAVLILAFLACSREHTARRDRLASLFWQQADVEQARGSLRQTLSRLRAALGDQRDAIWSDNEQIGLVAEHWSVDVDALHACDGNDPAQVNPAWSASFMAGIHRRDPSIDAWLEGERQRHLQAVSRVFSRAIDASLDNGDATQALQLGAGLTALDPFAEPAHRQLMLTYEQLGDRPSALRQYRTLVRILDEGLGVAPDDSSRALYERLRHNPTPPAQSATAAIRTPTASAAQHNTVATPTAEQCQRLVTVLALRHDDAHNTSARQGNEDLVKQYGGEALLSHGAEAMFIFGLNGGNNSGALAAVQAAIRVRDANAGEPLPASGCACGLARIDADAYPVGSVVQRAARLALLADAGDFLIDRGVLAQIPPQDNVEEVVLRDQHSYRLHSIDLHPVEPAHDLYGRRVELAQLEHLLISCEQHGATIAILAGEAGMGKSHLVLSLQNAAHDARRAVIRLAFTPRDVSPASITEQLVRALHEAILEHDNIVCFDAAQQATLTRLLDPSHAASSLPHEDVNRHRFDLISLMLSSFTRQCPVLIIVEDCHWADAADINLLIDVVDAHSQQALMMVSTERRENDIFSRELGSRVINADVVSLTLTPLSRRDAHALVAARVQDETLQQRILERAGGHPLFLTQLTDVDLEPDGPVPVSVVALVQNELDTLSERAREACVKAATLGIEFSLMTLESIFPEIDREDLAAIRLIKQQGDRLRFAHALVHEAVYALLSPDVISQWHRLAAEHYRSINPGNYAYHALRCNDTAVAVEACCSASEQLLADNRYIDAQRLIDQGFQFKADGDQYARLLLSSMQLQRDRGELDQAVASCQNAFDSAVDPALQVRSLVSSALLLKRRRALDRAASQLKLASHIADDAALPPAVLAELEHEWGNNMFMQGNTAACLEHHRRAHQYAEQAHDPRMQATALGGLGDAHYAQGKCHSAHRCYRDCVQLAEDNQLPQIAIAHRSMAGFTAYFQQPGEHVFEPMQQAIDEARRWSNASYETLARLAYMEALIHALRIDEAEAELNAIDTLQSRFGGDRFLPDQHYGRVLWRWARTEEAQARALAEKAIQRFGEDTYMGPSLHAAFAALCDEETIADQSLAEASRLMRVGSVLHNRINVVEFASASYWRRGQQARAAAQVQQAQSQFGAEPVGLLSACLNWMNTHLGGTAAPPLAVSEAVDDQCMAFFTVTHPSEQRAQADRSNTTAAHSAT